MKIVRAKHQNEIFYGELIDDKVVRYEGSPLVVWESTEEIYEFDEIELLAPVLPSKIVVQCQNERSQHKNKETCFKMLKARLYEHEIQKREEENQKELDSKTDIGWGHQIRSYVLQPYQLVKDLRNKTENTNPSSVLDGNIDQFIEEGIKSR